MNIQDLSGLQQYIFFCTATFVRYWIVSGGLYVLTHRTRQTTLNTIPQIPKTEIFWSMWSIPIISLPAVFLFTLRQFDFIVLDTGPFALHGWWLAVFHFVFLLFLHDTYFYWLHRFMHLPQVFNKIHKVHHLSRNPTAFAALTFHPFEAFLEMMFFPIAILLLQGVHFYTVVVFFTIDFIANAYFHSEFTSSKFFRSRWGQWLNSPTRHRTHHKYSHGNYSFYFTFWDKICSTLR